jgi:hypothetical protein
MHLPCASYRVCRVQFFAVFFYALRRVLVFAVVFFADLLYFYFLPCSFLGAHGKAHLCCFPGYNAQGKNILTRQNTFFP